MRSILFAAAGAVQPVVSNRHVAHDRLPPENPRLAHVSPPRSLPSHCSPATLIALSPHVGSPDPASAAATAFAWAAMTPCMGASSPLVGHIPPPFVSALPHF